MNFKQQIAMYVLGYMSTNQLPDVAVTGLKEGYDTPSLCILAGLSKNDNFPEFVHYFERSLEELNIKPPGIRQAALEYALVIVDEIFNGEKDVITGTREIHYKALDRYNFSSENKHYCYDSIGFEKAYGLFDTFDELSIADHPWQTNKTNEQLMLEVKTELFEELKIWKNKIKNGV